MYVCMCIYVRMYVRMCVCVYIYIYNHASFHSLFYESSIASYVYIDIYSLTKRKPLSRYGIFGLRIELWNSWTRNRRIKSASSNVCVCFFVLSVSFVCMFVCSFLSFFLISFRKSAYRIMFQVFNSRCLCMWPTRRT